MKKYVACFEIILANVPYEIIIVGVLVFFYSDILVHYVKVIRMCINII